MVALQSESLWLADVLQERARRTRRCTRRLAEPEPGVALGRAARDRRASPPSLAVGGALLESQLPGGLELLNPLRLMGATDDGLRPGLHAARRAPGLIELASSIAAVASRLGAAVASASARSYRRVFGTAALLLCLLAPAARRRLRAAPRARGRPCASAPSETVDGTLVVVEREPPRGRRRERRPDRRRRAGHLAGTVRGNLYVFARALELTGTVTGSRASRLVENLDVDGEVEGSVYTASDRLRLGADRTRSARDLALLGNDVVLAGSVGARRLLRRRAPRGARRGRPQPDRRAGTSSA